MNNELSNLKLLQSKSILYIEDEEKIRTTLSKTLEMMAKKVYSFADAQNAFDDFMTIKPDIILTDVSLEEMNGIEFIQKIRQFDQKIPIIILSAHTDTKFLLEASKLKLVEYLTKPATFKELKNALISAVEELPSSEVSFLNLSDTIRFDTSHKILYDHDKNINLSSSELNLLEFFIKNQNRTVSNNEIKNHIWEDSYYATDTALKSLIHKLRQKIGKDVIKNVSGIGYYLVKLD